MLLHAITRIIMEKQYQDYAPKHPHIQKQYIKKTQERCLQRILSYAKHTYYGKHYRFAKLKSVADFQKEVPVKSYADYKQDLEKVYLGDYQHLVPEKPLYFAMTSGSSGEYKYIPITKTHEADMKRAILAYYHKVHSLIPSLGQNTIQILVGSAEGGLSPGGIRQGFASGFQMLNLPWFVKLRYAMPYDVFTIEDAADRYYVIARLLLQAHDHVKGLIGVSPVNLINVAKAMNEDPKKLIRDIDSGEITTTHKLPQGLIAWQKSHVKPLPVLATQLRRLFEAKGVILPKDCMQLIMMAHWLGGSMSYYLDELKYYYGSPATIELPLAASEAVMAIPQHLRETGGIPAFASHFFEYFSLNDLEAADFRHPKMICDLEINELYGVVLTTAGGLYRYSIEDIVRVKAIVNGMPLLEFISKKSRQLSIANERISELDVTKAMEQVRHTLHLNFDHFLFVPCSDRKYRVLIDEDQLDKIPTEKRNALANVIDQSLAKVAKGYEFERGDHLIEPLEIFPTKNKSLSRYITERQFQTKLPHGQFKPIHLTQEWDLHKRDLFHAE